MHPTLSNLRHALDQTRAGNITVHQFSSDARQQSALLAQLPPPFETVLLNLLDRLESSALFSEESCSFSQKDLLDSIQLWLDKAEAKLRG